MLPLPRGCNLSDGAHAFAAVASVAARRAVRNDGGWQQSRSVSARRIRCRGCSLIAMRCMAFELIVCSPERHFDCRIWEGGLEYQHLPYFAKGLWQDGMHKVEGRRRVCDLRGAGLRPDPRPMQSRLSPVRGTRVVLLSSQYGLGRFPTEEVHQGDLHSFSRLEGRVWSASGCDVVVFPKVCARCAACCVRK